METQLPSLLGEIERGETIVITRHGKPIARIVPEADRCQARIERALAEIEEFRKTMPDLSLDDILSARHAGHLY